jgi:hypothetical protein
MRGKAHRGIDVARQRIAGHAPRASQNASIGRRASDPSQAKLNWQPGRSDP